MTQTGEKRRLGRPHADRKHNAVRRTATLRRTRPSSLTRVGNVSSHPSTDVASRRRGRRTVGVGARWIRQPIRTRIPRRISTAPAPRSPASQPGSLDRTSSSRQTAGCGRPVARGGPPYWRHSGSHRYREPGCRRLRECCHGSRSRVETCCRPSRSGPHNDVENAVVGMRQSM